MIKLNKKTQQDFLNREWVQKLLDVGVDMSDAKYALYRLQDSTEDFVVYQGKFFANDKYYNGIRVEMIVPTYTVSELLYKLHEWIYPNIDGIQYFGGLSFCKDAPFYIWYYNLKTSHFEEDGKETPLVKCNYLCTNAEYPIESLAELLIKCHTHNIGISAKDTGDISDK